MLEQLTFPLALLGYAGLAACAALATRRGGSRVLLGAVAVVVVLHVGLVWTFRYEWQLARATRNGYLGFTLFHTALACIVAAVFAEAWARRLVTTAFLVVTAGAIGATFRYDEVALYRVPVLLLAAMGLTGVALGARVANADG